MGKETGTMTVIASLNSQVQAGARIVSLPAADVGRLVDEMYAMRGWDQRLDPRADLTDKIRRGNMKWQGRRLRVTS